MPTQQTHGVFISYRRQDAAFHAGWLYGGFAGRFGSSYVFKDVDSIRPGEDFVNAITSAIRSCHTLLVVMGPKWLAVSDRRDLRRIDKPNDFVRLEIETALAQGVHIIPVLVLDAAMPTPDELPESVRGFARRNAIEITSSHFQADLARLMSSIEQIGLETAAQTGYLADPNALRDGAAAGRAQSRLRAVGRSVPPGGPPAAEIPRRGASNWHYPPSPVHQDAEPRRNSWTMLGIALTVLVMIGLIGFVAYQLSLGRQAPAQVAVPALVGATEEEARNQLAQAGLKVGTLTRTEGEADQIGRVITCDPEPGTKVDGASLVNIAIGIQATTVPIPTVQGQDAGDAQQVLESAGFKVTKETVDGGGDSGSVVGTSPPAGTQAKKGSTVALQISSGDSGTLPMPNVLGLDQQDAQARLASAGFTRIDTLVRQVQQPQFDGRVIEQDPPAGLEVDTGVQVRLVIGQVDSVGGGNRWTPDRHPAILLRCACW